MSLGLYERRARARRRLWLGVFKWTVGLGAVIAAGIYAYLSASALVEREVAALRQEIVDLNDTVALLQRGNAEQQQAMAAARQDLAEWQERYNQDVPTGDMKELFDLAREKLRAGVEPSRLVFLIRTAKNEDACDNSPTTKRFIVQTPFYNGANDVVSFADGLITVMATGQSATDDKGNVEVRFDPTQPVDVRFTELGGEMSNATGVLPIHHSVVVADTEYRFSVLAGESGFVHVTADSCRYP